VRQTDSVHTSNVSYLYYLSRIKGKIIDEMNGNYTGNERSRGVKLRAAVLGVADIARARNSHSNFPTVCTWHALGFILSMSFRSRSYRLRRRNNFFFFT